MEQIECVPGNYRDVFVKVPKQRGNRDKVAAAFMVIAISLGLCCCVTEESIAKMNITNFDVASSFSVQGLMASLATLVLCQMLADTCYRVALFCEEASHLDTRYENDWKNVLEVVFKPRAKKTAVYCTLFLICLAVLVVYTALISIQFLLLPPTYAAAYLLLHVIGFWSPRKYEVAQMKDIQSQLGHSFAWQYYYGYLKIILPSLVERMKTYEQNEGVKIFLHKLFLIMPDSCDLQPLFEQHPGDTETIELAKNLSDVVLNRTGNHNRRYNNPVYRIETRSKEIYLCMEGVSMLNSLRDMTSSEPRTGLSAKARYQQICFFYSTLKSILVEEKLDHLVEMIFYKEKTDDGGLVRVSEVVLTRLRELVCET